MITTSVRFGSASHREPVAALALCLAFGLAFASTAPTQTGRTLTLVQAPELGGVGAWEAGYPQTAVGNLGWFLIASHSARTFPTPAPGFTVLGSCRLGINEVFYEQFMVFDASRTVAMQIGVPRSAVFFGLEFDVQTLDYEPASQTLAWGDNDLELRIGAGQFGQGLDLVAIPPGTFLMSKSHYCDQNQPFVQVAIDYPFWIAKFEVTNGLYDSVTGLRPGSPPQVPVGSVTFAQAEAFCALLTAREAAANRLMPGYVYRLPTEAEWERCCRAGTTTIWNVGNTLSCSDARGLDASQSIVTCRSVGWQGCYAGVVAVGSYPPNQLGLCDMHGNVAEWCYDSWDAIVAGVFLNPHLPTPVGDPVPVRGGSYNWFYGPAVGSGFAPRTSRDADFPWHGLRFVLAPPL